MPGIATNPASRLGMPSNRSFVQRRTLAQTLSSLSLKNESDLITSLKVMRVINPAFHDKVNSLKDITSDMLSRTLTSERLGEVVNSFEARTDKLEAAKLTSVLRVEGIGDAAGKVADVSNIIWGIRDTLFEVQMCLLRGESLKYLMQGRKEKHLETQRMIKVAKALFAISIEVLESETNIVNSALEQVSPSKKDATEYYIRSSKEFIGAMAKDFNETIVHLSKKDLVTDSTTLSRREREIYEEIGKLLRGMAKGELKNEDARGATLSILEEIGNVPVANSREAAELNEFLEIVKFAINTSEKVSQGKRSPQALADSIKGATGNIESRLRKLERGAYYWLVPLCAAAIGISVVYIVYRASNLLEPGYTLSSYAAAANLYAAELFYATLSIVSNVGVIRSLVRTKGANGLSWLPELRSKLAEDPGKRSSAALFLASFNEPVMALYESTRNAIRAVWQYGNASLKILDDSVHISNHFGILGTLRFVRMMTARKEMFRRFAEEVGIADKSKARSVANILASEGTEIDDPETIKFAVVRAAQDLARHLNIYEKKVVDFGSKVQERYPKPQETTVNADEVRKIALGCGISRLKADYLADKVSEKLNSLARLSKISYLAQQIIYGRVNAVQPELVRLIVQEFKIDATQAQGLLKLIFAHREKISLMAREAVDEMDFFSNRKAQEIYLRVYSLMERIMYNDERQNNVEVELKEKMRQLNEWWIHRNGVKLRLTKWIPGRLWKKTSQVGEDIADFISGQMPLVQEIRKMLDGNAGMEFEKAEDMAWQRRIFAIRRHIETVIKGKYGFTDEEIKEFANGVIDDLSMNRSERKTAAFEFAQYLAKQARRHKCHQEGDKVNEEKHKYHEERHVEEAYGIKFDGSPESVLDLLEGDKYFGPRPGFSFFTAMHSIRDMGVDAKLADDLAFKIRDLVDRDPKKMQQNLLKIIDIIKKAGFNQENARAIALHVIEQHKKIVIETLNVAREVNAAVNDRTITPISTSDGMLGAVQIDVDAIRSEAYERTQFVHRLMEHKRGFKAGSINHAIHGLTIPETIGEILRQIVYKRVEEQFFGHIHIPEEVLTYIDREIVETIPQGVDARPEVIARRIVTAARKGLSLEKQTDELISSVYGRPRIDGSLRKKIRNIVSEINSRMMLHVVLQEMMKDPKVNIESVVKKHVRKLGLKKQAVENMISVAKKIREHVDSGKIRVKQDQFNKQFVFSSKRALPQDKSRKEKIRFFFAADHELDAQDAMEDLSHLLINSQASSAAQIAEQIISVRQLPEQTIKHKGKDKKPIGVAREIRDYTHFIDQVIGYNADAIKQKIASGADMEYIADAMIEMTRQMIGRGGETNYLDEARPEMSGLKYKFIGCFDADYKVNVDALDEIAPYFDEHSSYFFVGKRQFGRNDDEPVGKVMNNGGDAYWGFTNIENTLANVNGSWGSCVFHSTKSYMDAAKWIFNTQYEKHWRLASLKDYFTMKPALKKIIDRLKKRIEKQEKDIKDERKKKKIARPTKALLCLVELAMKLRNSRPGIISSAAVRTVGMPINWAFKGADFLYSISIMQMFDYLHERGIRGKRFGWARDIALDKKGNPIYSADEMLSSQDFTTESEDIASCMWPLRRLPFLTPGDMDSLGRAYNRIFQLISGDDKLFTPSQKGALERSGFIEGIGGQGSQPAYRGPLYNTFGGRWARGNAALFWQIMFTDLGPWRKIRYVSSAIYWLTGMARVSLFITPLIYMFLGIKPLITENLKILLGLALPTVGINMGAFIGQMKARGRTTRDAMRLLTLEPSVVDTQPTNVYYGFFLKDKPGFLATGKKEVVPIRAPATEMPLAWTLAGLNVAGTLWAADMFLRLEAGPWAFGAAIWTAFHATLLLTANIRLNPGVMKEPTSSSVARLLKDWFVPDYPVNVNKGVSKRAELLSEEGGKL